MSVIDQATVEKIARLAHLKLSPSEIAHFAVQLEKVLEHIRQLERLDTKGVAETVHALPQQNVWREDTVRPGLTQAQALAAAPQAEDGCFRVPRIIE